MGLSETSTIDELVELVDIGLVFGDDGCFGAGGYCRILRQETGVTSHNLDEEDAVVAGGGVAYLVDAVHNSVEGGIVADGGIGAV